MEEQTIKGLEGQRQTRNEFSEEFVAMVTVTLSSHGVNTDTAIEQTAAL